MESQGRTSRGREGYLQPMIHQTFLGLSHKSTLKGPGSNSRQSNSLRQLHWVLSCLALQPWEPETQRKRSDATLFLLDDVIRVS